MSFLYSPLKLLVAPSQLFHQKLQEFLNMILLQKEEVFLFGGERRGRLGEQCRAYK